MSTDITDEMVAAEPLFIVAAKGPEEDDDDLDAGEDGVDEDNDEFENPDNVADAYEEMRHRRHEDPWLTEEEEFERSPHLDDEMPESLLDLSSGGAS